MENMDHDPIRARLFDAIRALMPGLPVERHDPADGIPLQVTGFGSEEVIAMVETLLSTWVTMGREVRAFEDQWSSFCGRQGGVMVNSGSSANLVALGAMVEAGLLSAGDEVLVPAVAWSTKNASSPGRSSSGSASQASTQGPGLAHATAYFEHP